MKRFGRNQRRMLRAELEEVREIVTELGDLAKENEGRATIAERRAREAERETERLRQSAITVETHVNRYFEDMSIGVSAAARMGSKVEVRRVRIDELDLMTELRKDPGRVIRSISEGLAHSLLGEVKGNQVWPNSLTRK